MRKLLFLLCAMALFLPGTGRAADAVPADYATMPADYRAMFEAEMAYALANAHARIPTSSLFQAQTRGGDGYEGSKEDGGLRVAYSVTDSVVAVGEKVTFYVAMYGASAPITYTYGGAVMDERFNQTGAIVPAGKPDTFVGDGETTQIGKAFSFTPRAAGYFNYVIIVQDGSGNMLALSTPTIQVYEGEQPPFDNFGTDTNIRTETDDNLTVRLYLDKTSTEVGGEITATAAFTTLKDPVAYSASWTLVDDDGNSLAVERFSGETSAQGKRTEIEFPYLPLSAGRVKFLLTATDGDGNTVKMNSAHVPVADGIYLSARLDKASAVLAGDRVTAAYNVYGHRCDTVSCRIGWACFDGQGNTLVSRTEAAESPAGKSSYIPQVGAGLEFHVEAFCEHFPEEYPVRVQLTVVGGLDAELTLTSDTARVGESIGVRYSVDGSLADGQTMVVKGYSWDAEQERTYTFLTETVTDTEGTVYGVPRQGSRVYFELTLVGGESVTWRSGDAVLTAGIPGDADGDGRLSVHDALLVMQYTAGWSVTLSKTNADVNVSGGVDVGDAVLILQRCAGEDVRPQ